MPMGPRGQCLVDNEYILPSNFVIVFCPMYLMVSELAQAKLAMSASNSR